MKTKYLSMDKENIMRMCVCARVCVCTASEKEEPCCLQQYERALDLFTEAQSFTDVLGTGIKIGYHE